MIQYITFSPDEPARLVIGFKTVQDAEAFLVAQSGNIQWQAQFKLERVFAHGRFHWTASVENYVTLNFKKGI